MYTRQCSEQHPHRRSSSPVQSMAVSFRNASNAFNARWVQCGTYVESRDISGYHSTVVEGARQRCSDAVSLGWRFPKFRRNLQPSDSRSCLTFNDALHPFETSQPLTQRHRLTSSKTQILPKSLADTGYVHVAADQRQLMTGKIAYNQLTIRDTRTEKSNSYRSNLAL